MARFTLEAFRNDLLELLDDAYLKFDMVSMLPLGSVEYDNAAARLNMLKEMAQLARIHHIERQTCSLGSCGVYLKRANPSCYCSNACKQKAYRIRNGQMRK